MGCHFYSLILRRMRDLRDATRQIRHGNISGVLVTSSALVWREIMIGADHALA
jgi:hypothetical protein